ncbi:hypothetical protein [Streptomyces sp. NBRC 109706]|uniref:hypothetical protein n=1 Tax=Streptomyces sp. NBRC 109706 TaxID=1550035 RepID=UPI000A9515B2|nr:hypothetical protein [Streptomyces sp. NBRC 109706]
MSTPARLPYDEHWQGHVLGADASHRYLWLWYGYNIRLIATPHGSEGLTSYDHGWCYPRDPAAVEAAYTAWDPNTQDEPDGWHKRATHPARRAPHRESDPEYNRPRCAHGCYSDQGCRTINCPDSPPSLIGEPCPVSPTAAASAETPAGAAATSLAPAGPTTATP